MAEENDFTLKIGADDSEVRRKLEQLQQDFKSKPVIIDIKGKIDPSLQKTLSAVAALKTKAKGGSASDILLKEQRHAAKAANAFAASLVSATTALTAFVSKLAKSPAVPMAGAVGPAGFGATPIGKSLFGFNQVMMGLPGVTQLAHMAMTPLRVGLGFAQGSVSAYNTQNRAELQLRQVLKNSGMGDSEFNSIAAHAASLQRRTTIGDEAMLAGAGELSTYVKDSESMKRMMNLLADYAIGMNENSPEVNNHQMVEFATSLGKAFDGTYDAMRKKGFDTTELENLKKLEDAGKKVTEGQKIEALERALKDWNGLAENIAKTDEGKIVQLNNEIGDLRENMGRRLLPAFGRFAEAVSKHLPAIEKFFNAFTNAAEWFINLGTSIVETATPAVKIIAELTESLSTQMIPVIGGCTVAFGAMTAAMTKMQIQMVKTSISMMTNLSGVAGQAGSVTAGMSSLGSSLSSIVKGGLLGILAAEILAIGNAAWQAFSASREARKNNAAYANKVSDTDPMLKAFNSLKDAEKSGSVGGVINSRRDLEKYAQSYYDKNGTLPDYIAKKLGWDWANSPEASSPAPKPPSPPKFSPPPPVKVTQNNYISTEFDSLGKLIKENLREIAISRLTFRTGSESAKAMAI